MGVFLTLDNDNIKFYFHSAIILSGSGAGRLTSLAVTDEGTNHDISMFKRLCCATPLCSRYEDKRPILPIALFSSPTMSKFYVYPQ